MTVIATDPPPAEQPVGVPLSQLRHGDRGVARTCGLAEHECELLSAMGLTDQCPIRVCRRGAACIVKAGATRLGISTQLAERIRVVPNGIAV